MGVNGLRDQFLARPGLAENQDAAVGGGHELDLLPQRLHRNAIADDHTLGRELPLQIAIFQAKLLGFYRVFDQG